MAVYYVGRGRLADVLRKFKEEYLQELAPGDLETDVILKLVATRQIAPDAQAGECELRENIVRMMEEF